MTKVGKNRKNKIAYDQTIKSCSDGINHAKDLLSGINHFCALLKVKSTLTISEMSKVNDVIQMIEVLQLKKLELGLLKAAYLETKKKNTELSSYLDGIDRQRFKEEFSQLIEVINQINHHEQETISVAKQLELTIKEKAKLIISKKEYITKIIEIYDVQDPERIDELRIEAVEIDRELTLKLKHFKLHESIISSKDKLSDFRSIHLIQEEMEILNRSISENKETLAKLTERLADIPMENAHDIDEEMDEVGLDLTKSRLLYDQFQVMAEVINKIERELNLLNQPEFINIANCYLSKITDGSIQGLTISLSGELKALKENVYCDIDMSSLSTGTIGQITLSLKLALLKITDPSCHMPLILDDTCIHFDSTRTKEALDLLSNIAQTRQVIYLTSQLEKIKSCLDFNEVSLLLLH
jgi:uncharacterized protein YhaN